MMLRIASVVVVLALAACSSDKAKDKEAPAAAAKEQAKPEAPEPDEKLFEPLLQQSNSLVDELCACADLACAEGVQAKWNEVATQGFNTPPYNDPGRATTNLRRAATNTMMEHGQRMKACMGKFAPDAAPAEPPPPPPPSLTAAEITKGLKKLADDMCACKDMSCAKKVQGELETLASSAVKLSKKQQKKNREHLDLFNVCLEHIEQKKKK